MNVFACLVPDEVGLMVQNACVRHAEAKSAKDHAGMQYWSERTEYWRGQQAERMYEESVFSEATHALERFNTQPLSDWRDLLDSMPRSDAWYTRQPAHVADVLKQVDAAERKA